VVEIGSNLTGDITAGLDRFEAHIKESILLSGVAAMGQVMYDELKLQTSPPKIGRVTGNLNEAVYSFYAKDKSSDVEKIYHVSVNKSKAQHFHLIENGTSKMLARAPVRKTFDRVGDAIEAGKKRIAERMAGGA
jgi:hypothetical protein